MQAQWTKQSPIPTGEEIEDACFINPDTGWIFGFSGTIMRTNDGGANWIDQSIQSVDAIYVGMFIESSHGWIASADYSQTGNGQIYGTNNGGYTWYLQFSDTTCAIRDLSFINPDTGWALAYYRQSDPVPVHRNFFLKTNDGGENWYVLDSLEQFYFHNVDFINASVGYIAGAGIPNLMKTIDGGETWQASPHASDAGLTDVLFTGINNGYSCGNNFYFTHNSGASWSSTYCYHSYKVDMYDQFNGWTISIDKIYRVTNGGENVDYQFTLDKSLLVDILAFDSANAYAFGRNVCIYSTSDGGNNWQEISNGTRGDLYSVFFLNENDGWAGGEDLTLLITHDGGQHWIYNDLGSEYPVTDIQFISPDTGFLVNGNILRSTDGGLSWSQTSGWSYSISDLYFLDSQLGWCAGADGGLFKTMNSGVDWEEINSGTDKALNAVYFIDSNYGWIAGDGIIKRTTDGGKTWEESYVSDAEFLKIQFFNQSVGYILADRFYLKTSTEGESWQAITPEGMSGPYSLEDLCFIDQETGYLSGTNYLLKTTDGGASWDSVTGLPEVESNAIFFVNELKGWIVGDDGAIYQTETGGTVSVSETGNENQSSYIIYPNPSGDIFRIKYTLESMEDIEIGIYTLQGLKIRYFKETGLNPGSYSFYWDPANLPSGIYFCKIRIGDYSGTEKMVYIK